MHRTRTTRLAAGSPSWASSSRRARRAADQRAPSAGCGRARRRAPAPATRAPSRSPSTRGSAPRPTSRSSAACSRTSSATRSRRATLAEEVAWQGFETGEVDAILENWGHPDLEKLYITDKKVAQDAGPNGVDRDHRLVRPASGWRRSTPTSSTGTTSTSTPSCSRRPSPATRASSSPATRRSSRTTRRSSRTWTSNFKVVYSGSEAASITAFQQADRAEDAAARLLLRRRSGSTAEIKLVKVNLPA